MEILQTKIRFSGQDTLIETVLQWKNEIDEIELKAEYIKKSWKKYLENDESLTAKIDWEKIASVVFEDRRNAEECRYRFASRVRKTFDIENLRKY